MTFEQYLADCQRRQRAYIRGERARYAKAKKLWDAYEAQMAALDLHPLDSQNIYDRERELDRMERDVPVWYGDTPSMRACYALARAAKE